MSDDARALSHAQALLDLGRHDQALRDAGSVLARDPGSADAQRIVGEALLKLDRWDELAPVARQAVASFPDDAWAWRLHAFVQLEIGAEADALEAAHRLRALAPEETFALCAYARVMHSFGHAGEAVPVLERALQTKPDDVDLHLARAVCLWKVGRSRDARDAVSTALRIDPASEDAQLTMAIFGIPGRRGSDGLIDVAQRAARAPDDDDNELLFELASSRVLAVPASVVFGTCVASLVVCVLTGGLWGWRVDTGIGILAGAGMQAALWLLAVIVIGLWLRRMRRDLGALFAPIVSSRMGDGVLSKFGSWGIAGGLVLSLIGIVLYATAGDPLGTTVLVLAVASAYAAAALVLLFQLLPRGIVTPAMVSPPALLILLWPGLIAGVALLAIFLVGAVLYILVWSFSGDKLPEPFPGEKTTREKRAQEKAARDTRG